MLFRSLGFSQPRLSPLAPPERAYDIDVRQPRVGAGAAWIDGDGSLIVILGCFESRPMHGRTPVFEPPLEISVKGFREGGFGGVQPSFFLGRQLDHDFRGD